MQAKLWFHVRGRYGVDSMVKGNRLNRVDDLYCRLKAVKLIGISIRKRKGAANLTRQESNRLSLYLEFPDKNININHERFANRGGQGIKEKVRQRERSWPDRMFIPIPFERTLTAHFTAPSSLVLLPYLSQLVPRKLTKPFVSWLQRESLN